MEVPMFDWKSICFMVPVLVIPIATAVAVIPPTVNALHEQTLQQCRDKDWPIHQAPQHEEFCALYFAGKY
jgi:hypothetical protein